ncbi:hypothetical protein [Erythrobacter sanguineus]
MTILFLLFNLKITLLFPLPTTKLITPPSTLIPISITFIIILTLKLIFK